MRTRILAALAVGAATVPATAAAQDVPQAEVYVGLSAGYHDLGVNDDDFDDIRDDIDFDLDADSGGFIYGGFAGVDFPVSETFFVGAEGNYHGGTGLIDSEYGVSAHIGTRLEGGAKLFVRGGYQEVDFDVGGFGFDELIDDDVLDDILDDFDVDTTEGDYLVGAGVDFPLGEGGSGLRITLDTLGFDTVRATAGVSFGF